MALFRWTHYLHWASLIDVSSISFPPPDFAEYPYVSQGREERAFDGHWNRSSSGPMLHNGIWPSSILSDEARESERAAIAEAIETFVALLRCGKLSLGGRRNPRRLYLGRDASDRRPTRLVKRLLDLLEVEVEAGVEPSS